MRHVSFRRFSNGFSLVEAMVALLVISTGMIGVAAMFGQGLGASRNALYRTQAVHLVADMGDRIRVNRLGGLAYNNDPADRSCDPGGDTDCTPQQMAEHDLWVWEPRVAQMLPAGVGTVVVVDGTPPTYTITVRWQESGFGETAHTIAIQVPDI
jgi:type IV pilus assembly protein PilV